MGCYRGPLLQDRWPVTEAEALKAKLAAAEDEIAVMKSSLGGTGQERVKPVAPGVGAWSVDPASGWVAALRARLCIHASETSNKATFF